MWKTPRTLLIAGATLVVGLGVGAAVVPTLAAQDPVLTPDQQSQLQQQVAAYKACLEQQGITLPAKPADGTRPQLSDEQRATLQAAHAACEGQEPQRPQLSDEQKAQLQAQAQQFRDCMTTQLGNAGVTLPERPAPGTEGATGTPPARPQLSDSQKAAIEAANQACESLRPNLGGGVGPMGGNGFGGGPGGFGFGGPGGPGRPGGASGQGSAI